jgi:hypothetical protein
MSAITRWLKAMSGRLQPQGAPTADTPDLPLAQKLAWFVGLAAAGVVATAVGASALHALLYMK